MKVHTLAEDAQHRRRTRLRSSIGCLLHSRACIFHSGWLASWYVGLIQVLNSQHLILSGLKLIPAYYLPSPRDRCFLGCGFYLLEIGYWIRPIDKAGRGASVFQSHPAVCSYIAFSSVAKRRASCLALCRTTWSISHMEK
jgi:hypothetical protein